MHVIRMVGVVAVAFAIGVTPAAAQTKAATPKPPKPQISATTREKAAEQGANPDAVVLADFQKRVDAYMAIHRDAKKDAPPQKETKDASKIQAAQDALGVKIRAARATAKAGDVLTPEVQNKFRRLMYPVVQGPAAQGTSGSTKAVKADVKETLKENTEERKEEGKTPVVLKVNARYPPDTPLPTTPPQVLMNLPKLPPELEYRIIGKNLIIRDVDANIIVDFVPNAIQ
jgi:hypothetical protein